MIFKISIKPIFFIFCLVGIYVTEHKFNLAVRAQNTIIQETITQENNFTDLSQQEKIDLQQGKVVLKGQKGNYVGRVLATGNFDKAWEVLTDYDNFDRFLPNIASSKILSEEGDRIIFGQVNVVDLWLFKQEFEVEIEAIKTKPTKVDFKIVDGDLKKLIGKWEIEELSPGNILVRHTVEVEPGSNTEKPFFYGVYESSLEDTLKAIALEITNRSTNIP